MVGVVFLKNKTIGYFLFIAILFISYIVVFLGIVEELRENELVRFDSAIIQFVQGLVSDRLTSAMKVITYFGSKTWLTFATLGISILLVLMHKKRFAVFLLFSSTAGGLFNMLLKWIFKRERPDIYPIIVEHGFSFPSGHSMGSFIFYGALAIILVKISTPVYLDWLFGGFCALIIFLIGLSRIYLGVHYPSDVIAGFAAGGAWLTICGLLFRYGEYLLKKAKESQGIKGSYNK